VTEKEENKTISKECFEEFLTKVDWASGKEGII
jgi:hypothetical protein